MTTTMRRPAPRPGSATPDPELGGPAVSTVDLTKAYRDIVAVDGLTLDISPGEVFGLLGPNGAGKTTTILMLLGMTEPTGGSVRVLGADPTRDPLLVKSRVGYLPDEVGFYENLTARQNLRYTAALNRIRRREAEERIERLLVDVGLGDDADRKVGTYSRGMRQRLGVADALMKQPSMLILDEPTVNIDPEGVRELLLLVERLRTDQGVTVLLSSHLLHQVQQVCDRIGIFVAGRLVACGTVDELAADLDHRWSFMVGLSDVPDPRRLLEAVTGVREVSRSEGRWAVEADEDIRPELGRAVQEVGGTFTHLARRTADLDAIYHRYFGTTDASDGENPPDAPAARTGRGRAGVAESSPGPGTTSPGASGEPHAPARRKRPARPGAARTTNACPDETGATDVDGND